MFNPVGTKCILLDPCGRETIGCVPEIDVSLVPERDCVPGKMNVYVDAPKIGTLVYRDMRESRKFVAEKVVFNPPATVVLWADGTKTVVKCDPEDTFNETTGVALCYMKKALGNTSRELNKALRKARGFRDGMAQAD